MIDLDELLTGAAERLDDATAHLAIPAPPRAARPVGRYVAIGVGAAAAVAGVVAVRARDHRTLRPAQDPPGLYDGTYGDEITLTELPDGDDDPTTWKLVASPAGGEVTAERQDTTVTTIAATAVDDTVVTGTAPAGADPGDTVVVDTVAAGGDPTLCITTTNAGGVCGAVPDELTMQLGTRGDDGQALVTGVPAGAAAVTFRAGDVRWWTRPVNGVALFPFPATASTTATVTVLDPLGGTLATRTDTNSTLTDAEVAAAVVTQGTGERLAGGWYLPRAFSPSYGGAFTRLEGRTGQTGFSGPFTSQSFVVDPQANRWLVVLTVPTDDADDVTQRLTAAPGGSVRRTLDEPGDVTVLIWADDAVDDATIDRAAASLSATDPAPEFTISVDSPRSFHSDSVFMFAGMPVLGDLLTDTVTAGDGSRLRLERDDLGDVNVMLLGGAGESAYIGPHAAEPVRVPQAGDSLWRLTAVPADLTSLSVSLDDGSTLDLPLADLRPYADAKIAIAPTTSDRRVIVAVDAR